MRKTLIFILAALLLPSLLPAAEKLTAAEYRAVGLQALKEGTRSIDFELKDLSGKKVSLSSLKGKVVFLNFWATWCPPCRAEMPSMERLYKRFKDKGLVILAVNLREEAKTVRKFVAANKLSFPVLLDTDGRIGAIYGAHNIPTSYLVSRDGNVLAGAIGGREWDSKEYISFFARLLELK
jgi:thiol-disulfide isomerase/thioredoxin